MSRKPRIRVPKEIIVRAKLQQVIGSKRLFYTSEEVGHFQVHRIYKDCFSRPHLQFLVSNPPQLPLEGWHQIERIYHFHERFAVGGGIRINWGEGNESNLNRNGAVRWRCHLDGFVFS